MNFWSLAKNLSQNVWKWKDLLCGKFYMAHINSFKHKCSNPLVIVNGYMLRGSPTGRHLGHRRWKGRRRRDLNLLLLVVPVILGLGEDVQEMRLVTEYSSASSAVILEAAGVGAMHSWGGRLRWRRGELLRLDKRTCPRGIEERINIREAPVRWTRQDLE